MVRQIYIFVYYTCYNDKSNNGHDLKNDIEPNKLTFPDVVFLKSHHVLSTCVSIKLSF